MNFDVFGVSLILSGILRLVLFAGNVGNFVYMFYPIMVILYSGCTFVVFDVFIYLPGWVFLYVLTIFYLSFDCLFCCLLAGWVILSSFLAEISSLFCFYDNW
jgi:hypothetical protein